MAERYDPRPNFHSARVKHPRMFSRITTLKTLPNGIHIVGGVLKSDPGGGSKPQTYLFPKKRFTPEKAKKWLREHNIKYTTFELAKEKK